MRLLSQPWKLYFFQFKCIKVRGGDKNFWYFLVLSTPKKASSTKSHVCSCLWLETRLKSLTRLKVFFLFWEEISTQFFLFLLDYLKWIYFRRPWGKHIELFISLTLAMLTVLGLFEQTIVIVLNVFN